MSGQDPSSCSGEYQILLGEDDWIRLGERDLPHLVGVLDSREAKLSLLRAKLGGPRKFPCLARITGDGKSAKFCYEDDVEQVWRRVSDMRGRLRRAKSERMEAVAP